MNYERLLAQLGVYQKLTEYAGEPIYVMRPWAQKVAKLVSTLTGLEARVDRGKEVRIRIPGSDFKPLGEEFWREVEKLTKELRK